MLDQVIRWVDIVGTIADVLLLIRLLTLRLHKVYVFITLYAAVTTVLDAGAWMTGLTSPASLRLFVYSRFLMAAVFPLTAWDVFEEVQQHIGKLRRLHTMRLVSGLLLTSVFALVLSASLDDPDVEGMGAATIQVALLLWAATVSASGLFLWNMRRTLRQVIGALPNGSLPSALPNNTSVLWVFVLLTLIGEILECLLHIFAPMFPANVTGAIDVVVSSFDTVLVMWCIVRLRGAGTATSSVSRVGVE